MRLDVVICDVFTDRPLAGNQLAVFTDARGLDDATMQALARETNFSETTFVLPATHGGDAFVRIFTPGRELPFAGHPTLGTAFVLASARGLAEVRLEMKGGDVPVRFERRDARRGFGWMHQPIPRVEAFAAADRLLAALGERASLLPIEVYDNGVRHAYVMLASREEVAALRPDPALLAALGEPTGFNVFAGAGTRWKTRMFAPAHGVSEDPATGSAAGPLALHLARHGRIRFGEPIEIEQGVEIGRPSRLHARVEGSLERVEQVEVGGGVVRVAEGAYELT